ncbi:MAG: hypothetical protein LBQ99_03805 [Endomicrobium sp.]|jgi:superoxide reductase|nr:hypothetical protein [Endomicrobium sp.]
MRGLVCKMCGYVSLSEVESQCPVCKAKDVFQMKEDAYNYKMLDIEKIANETEKKHIPVFTIVKKCDLIPESECLDVHVKIGEVTHPMLSEHCITEITFYVNNKFVENVMFTPNIINAATVIHLKGDIIGKVQVIGNCNLHGKWFNEVCIK